MTLLAKSIVSKAGFLKHELDKGNWSNEISLTLVEWIDIKMYA
jgi:hypothetical protein